MSANSFVQKLLSFQFILGTGQFGETGNNVATLSGLRASIHVERAGGPSMATARIKIWGMEQSMMNQLSTLGQIATSVRRNSVLVTAGVAGGVMSTVFTGTIKNGYGSYAEMPNVPFVVDAFEGFADSIAPNPPTSFVGNADVAAMLSGLATQMGLEFENNGVTTKLQNPYYVGAPRIQARKIVEDAGIEWNGGENGVLAIWPAGQARGNIVIEISPPPTGGMIGYPDFFSLGIRLRNLWDPSIGFGRTIKVNSSLPMANHNWVVANLVHDLESMVPKGKWESMIEAAPVGLGPIVPS